MRTMKIRTLSVVCSFALLAAVFPCSAALLVNGDWSAGDETGWTRWQAGWGSANLAVTNTGPTSPEGTAWLDTGQTGSFGWYQVVDVPVGLTANVQADWAGSIGAAGWADVMLFSVAAGTALNDIVTQIDAHSVADIAYEKNSGGMNPPTDWDWEPAALSPHTSGNNGSVGSLGWVVVALKLGSNDGGVWAGWDNVSLTTTPIADVDGPYTLDTTISSSIILDGTASFDLDGGGILAWYWDLDNDGSFDDGAGAQPEVTAALLDSLGWTLNETRDVHLVVGDDEGTINTATTTLTYVPEPATLTLLALGGLALLYRRR